MGSDSKSKKKKEGKSDKSVKSVKSSKSKEKEKDSKSPSKKEKKEKDTKSKKNSKVKNQQGQSELSSIHPTAPISADCVHHKNPFIYFCETCEQLICNQCTVYGPHNNHLHRILKITDAYRSRVFYLSEAIRSNLVDKRDKIIAQLHRLEYRSEQIKFVKNIISRDIRSQYSGILQRLKNCQGVRLANISHQVSLTQKQIDTINDLGNTFFDLTSFQLNTAVQQERKICKFLNKSKNMYQAIQYLLNKPDRPLPQIKHQQLPRQIDQNRNLLQKAVAAKQINEFKNQVMWNLMNDLRQQQKNIKIQVDSKANSMIRQLGQQAQRLNGRLQSFKMVCVFCGQKLNPETINNQCQKNLSKQQANIMVKTQKTPNENYFGNRRHFFSKKIQDS